MKFVGGVCLIGNILLNFLLQIIKYMIPQGFGRPVYRGVAGAKLFGKLACRHETNLADIVKDIFGNTAFLFCELRFNDSFFQFFEISHYYLQAYVFITQLRLHQKSILLSIWTGIIVIFLDCPGRDEKKDTKSR